MFCVVNMYLDHLKFCVVCIHGRRYVGCSECNVVSNECIEPRLLYTQAPKLTHTHIAYPAELLLLFATARSVVKSVKVPVVEVV